MWYKCEHVILGCGVFLLILAIFVNLLWDDVTGWAVRRELILSKSSKSYDLWLENPFPFYIKFYFFNWTNPSDLKKSGYKPVLQEIGPYKFREHIKKVDLIWNENGTVTYKKHRTWYFEPESGNESLDDVVTTLNVIALLAARTTKYWNRLARIPLSITLSSSQKMHIRKKVREFLFEGFADSLMEFASKIPGLSSRIPFDKFGWFYTRNGSSEFDGVFNMETGALGLDVLGQLRFWNHNNRTPYYEDHCGDVLGSAGDFWPLERPKNENIVLFSPDMCRYISFMYKKEETVEELEGYRYDSGPELFDNGTNDPRNKCFCKGKCQPSGTLNVSTCRFGAPAFVSYPHFHLADSSYLKSVSGLKPDSQKHDMYIILEQVWGIPLEVAVRLQINLLVEEDPGIRLYDGVPSIYFPIFWFEQKVRIPEGMRSEIKSLVRLPAIGGYVSIALYVLGLLCVVAFVYITRAKIRK